MLTAAIIQAYTQYEETRSFAFNVARSRYTIIIKNQLTDVVPSVISLRKLW